MSSETAVKRKIQLLSQEVYNRIAAGEVVERPSSVLKELIENSIDAGATSIEVYFTDAGRSEICVADDGEGMMKADLLLAFERHATSKVAHVDDLLVIRTLGFRGEALSAIASVSRVEATSRMKDSLSGYRLKLLGGKIQSVEEVGASEGTMIAVRDLFFNTPARKKFLKSKGIENSHLINVFKRYALAYPEIRWSLVMDGKDAYRLPPESLENRIAALFSDELADKLFPVMGNEEGIQLTGFITSPEFARKSRGDQYLYINRRWIQNRLIGHSIASAYGHLLEEKKYPLYVLFLQISPEEVDVNVHPAKSEVKFRREAEVYNLVHFSVGKALQKAGLKAFADAHLRSGERLDASTGEIQSVGRDYQQGDRKYSAFPAFREFRALSRRVAGEAYQLVFGRTEEPAKQIESKTTRPFESGDSDRTQVYQLHKRYIITEIKNGVVIIDQHAAHERILYEKALKALSGERLACQQLLFPKIIELDLENAVRLQEITEDLQRLGITIREFGEKCFVLEALPAGIHEGAEERIILDLLDELKERGSAKSPGQEQIAAAFACQAAIKFGQTLSLAEMNGLIDQLFASQFPFTCPHGRPTLLQLTLGELDRRFGRG